MKKLFIFSLFLMIISCGKESHENGEVTREISEALSYDTTAVDSFSPGATSVDVARRIRISSQNYQDSLKAVAAKTEMEKLAKAKDEQEKLSKKLEEEKKKTAADKAKTEKKQATPESPAGQITPNL